jgi:hypothetical protein
MGFKTHRRRHSHEALFEMHSELWRVIVIFAAVIGGAVAAGLGMLAFATLLLH